MPVIGHNRRRSSSVDQVLTATNIQLNPAILQKPSEPTIDIRNTKEEEKPSAYRVGNVDCIQAGGWVEIARKMLGVP